MNKNPHQARLGKKIRAKPGDLHEVQTIVWYTLKRAQYCLDIATEPEDIVRASHCVSQIAGQYAKLVEIGELEARLSALEQAMKGTNGAFHGYTTGKP
jgi:hypothetical protein